MRHLFILFIISFSLLSCATKKPEGKTAAEVIYKEALKLVDEGRYLLATERLNLIKSQYPYSYYTTHAELLQADILFKQENYVEAAAAYILFRDFHPKNKRISYVIWKIAESYYFQLPPTYDRDLSAAFEAIKYYEEILLSYPSSDYVDAAKKRIGQCKEMVWKKEKYIADFYYRTEVYDAAIFRYKDILKTFNVPSLRDHSMLRIVKSSSNLKRFSDCVQYSQHYLEMVSGKTKKELERMKQVCQNELKNNQS